MALDLLIDHVPLQVSWIYERYDLCVDTFMKSCNTYFRKIYRSFFQKYKNIYTKWQEMFLYHILSYCLLCKTLNFVDLIICKTYKLLWSMNWWWQDDTSNKKLLLDNLCSMNRRIDAANNSGSNSHHQGRGDHLTGPRQSPRWTYRTTERACSTTQREVVLAPTCSRFVSLSYKEKYGIKEVVAKYMFWNICFNVVVELHVNVVYFFIGKNSTSKHCMKVQWK